VEKPSMPLSTIKPLTMPCSSFAQTTATCEKGALLIHILAAIQYHMISCIADIGEHAAGITCHD
jgi:hypothetical protein